MVCTKKQTILVTGGAGYIGSHTAWQLSQQGYHVIIVDNFVHNQPWNHSWATVIRGDIGNQQLLEQIFTAYSVTAVMHFAAFIEVGRSVTNPAACYQNNVVNTIKLLDAMRNHQVNYFIFSSSCAVYGTPQKLPLTEDHPKSPISPYGASKLMIEQILHDYAHAYDMRFVALRYFNAAGALPEYNLGEYHEPETHVIPLLLRAAMNNISFNVFGTDHATPDGTCIRDYVHVLDIADAHIKALAYLQAENLSDCFNLGTGKGFSVQELITATEELIHTKLAVNYTEKRPGDPALLVADPSKAYTTLGWQPKHSSLKNILRSAYEFELQNKSKYDSSPVSQKHF
jgi:UDP-glucose-4-epimerase GalE